MRRLPRAIPKKVRDAKRDVSLRTFLDAEDLRLQIQGTRRGFAHRIRPVLRITGFEVEWLSPSSKRHKV